MGIKSKSGMTKKQVLELLYDVFNNTPENPEVIFELKTTVKLMLDGEYAKHAKKKKIKLKEG